RPTRASSRPTPTPPPRRSVASLPSCAPDRGRSCGPPASRRTYHRGMRAVLQRVDRVHVEVEGEVVGAVEGEGLLALIGVTHEDGPEQVATIARKICE